MGLSSEQKGIIGMSSCEAVSRAFNSVLSDLEKGGWIQTNEYLLDPVATLNEHDKSNTINSDQLCKYIAASIPTHCMDGWSFLSRAIHCSLRGDSTTAGHLAYYAELRAAMSLLASAGIGVFNNMHVVINKDGETLLFKGLGTHNFAWLALEEWSLSQSAYNLVGELITFKSFTLSQWLTEFGGKSNLSPLASSLLKQFGLDLKSFSFDRQTRNSYSYRPSHLKRVQYLSMSDRLSFIINLWNVFNPLLVTRFGNLDCYLLRKSLLATYQGIFAKKGDGGGIIRADNRSSLDAGVQESQSFKKKINSTMERLPLSSAAIEVCTNFFDTDLYPEPELLKHAETHSSIEDAKHHLGMISRAALLLRFATGSCAQLINDHSFSQDALTLWLYELGLERGFWSSGDKPDFENDGPCILWEDIDQTIQDILELEEREDVLIQDTANHKSSYLIDVMEDCEKIGMWGLLP